MVTAGSHHAIANLDNEHIMSLQIRRFALLAIALSLATPILAQQPEAKAEREAGRKPLNLSLPREAVSPPTATTRPDRIDDPSPMDQRWGERGDGNFAPYGTGFEARRRGMGGTGFGGNGGFGGGNGGGGRGGGRGR
jgi:hypothetical protein